MQPILSLVLERMGLADKIGNDEAGLREFYRAWCTQVPFDNMRKLIAHSMGGDQPLPGTESDDFFQNWLEHGTGGTCWASSNALYSLAGAAGFDVSRSTASMWDRGEATHGTVIARVEGRDWLVDSSILTMNPLPLEEGKLYVQEGPLHPVEVEWDAETFVFWFEAANYSMPFPCRLLQRHVEHAFYAGRYEATRDKGPFNERLFVRRNFPDRLVMLIGNNKWERTMDGQTETALSAEALVVELISQGYSRAIVDQWVECGGLEAAMAPPKPQPDPPPLSRVAPSRR